MKKLFLLAGLVLAAEAVPAVADSWLPFPDQRVPSPSGRHYAVVRSVDGGIRWELVRRRDGAPPIERMEDRFGEKEVARDPDDTVVAKGKLGQRPLTVRVLDDPAGLVLFEQYARVGYGDSLVVVIPGRPVVRRSLAQIVGEDLANRYRTENATVSSVWWYEGFLVDEEKRRIVVVTADDRLRAVDFDGVVSTPKDEILLRHLRIGTEEERMLALEAAARLEPEGLGAEALALAADDAEPLPIRLRATVAARRAGEKAPFEALFLTSVEKGNAPGVRSYAAAKLGEMLGTAAIPVLRRLMRGPADNDVWNPAKESFRFLGERAVPTLIEMLGEEGESTDYRGGAAHVLGELRAESALDALLAATEKAPDYVANAAVNAAIAIGAPDLPQRLAKILAAGSTQDSRIAMYFERHPASCAVAPLKAALARAAPGSFESRTIQNALAAQD